MKKLFMMCAILFLMSTVSQAQLAFTLNGQSTYIAQDTGSFNLEVTFGTPADSAWLNLYLDNNGNGVVDSSDESIFGGDVWVDGDTDDEDTTIGMYRETVTMDDLRFWMVTSGNINGYNLILEVYDLVDTVYGLVIDSNVIPAFIDTVVWGSIMDSDGNLIMDTFMVLAFPPEDSADTNGDGGPGMFAISTVGMYGIDIDTAGMYGFLFGPLGAFDAVFGDEPDSMTAQDSTTQDSLAALLVWTNVDIKEDSSGNVIPMKVDLDYITATYTLNVTILDVGGDTVDTASLDINRWPLRLTAIPFGTLDDFDNINPVDGSGGWASMDIWAGEWVVQVSGDGYWGMDTITILPGDDTTDMDIEVDFYIYAGMYSEVTLDLSGFPAFGQQFGVRAVNQVTGLVEDNEILTSIPSSNFQVTLNVRNGEPYNIEFYSDRSGNMAYDAPPIDEAWRLVIDTVFEDTTYYFSHDTTNYTDIEWNGATLTFQLTGMGVAHLGDLFQLEVVDQGNGEQVARVTIPAIVGDTFSVVTNGLIRGRSYNINFYADADGNGHYDAPAGTTDHAWTYALNNVDGDTSITWAHNTNFVDIKWKHIITINGSGFDPHVGQLFSMRLVDVASGLIVDDYREDQLDSAAGQIVLSGIEAGRQYNIDFFADHNGNGVYDAPGPSGDHAWRFSIIGAGDTVVNYAHNTNFTDINWTYWLGMQFNNMIPAHPGQKFEMRVIDIQTGLVAAETTVAAITDTNFTIWLSGLQGGRSYDIDFYADRNGDGYYDSPSVDHAWSMPTGKVLSNIGREFWHNTNFEDIEWDYNLTLNLWGMNPHLGQRFEFWITDTLSGLLVDHIVIDSILDTTVTLDIWGIQHGGSYLIEFFADYNNNGVYDAPPTDHAWEIMLDIPDGDTILDWTHNGNFIDINAPVGIEIEPLGTHYTVNGFQHKVIGNPVVNRAIISYNLPSDQEVTISIYTSLGTLVDRHQSGMVQAGSHAVQWNARNFKSGIYIYVIQAGEFTGTGRMMLK